MALIGYARVSTAEQDTALQTDALRKAGCERVFEDTVSGSTSERPGLSSALAFLREGDVLGVWRLDRLGRSLPHLIEVVAGLEARGVGFRSLTEAIDTTTPGGRDCPDLCVNGEYRRRGIVLEIVQGHNATNCRRGRAPDFINSYGHPPLIQ